MEKKLFKIFAFLLMVGLGIGFVACSDDDDIPGGTEKQAAASLAGTWYCTFQQWTEDGETESETYEPSSEYCIVFESDGTGYMVSGDDELFEIGTHGYKYFEWYVYQKSGYNWVHTSVYGGEDYRINKLTATTLTMIWRDEDYSITCTFERQ
ncbi:MAG: hypothetical protein IJ197_00370 [Bacteroidaceae bacterium]|nr:hypothetical protein [Bacteroidaceae bacterium]